MEREQGGDDENDRGPTGHGASSGAGLRLRCSTLEPGGSSQPAASERKRMFGGVVRRLSRSARGAKGSVRFSRKFNRDEEALRIEVALSRFVDDTHQSASL